MGNPVASATMDHEAGGRETLATIAALLLASGFGRRGRRPWTKINRSAERLERGARRAIALRLAGIYHAGLGELGLGTDVLSGDARTDLLRARRREIADHLSARRQSGEILSAMVAQGVRPVMLKGLSFADRLWPRPWMRPPGDLDLLVTPDQLGLVLETLGGLGYRPYHTAADVPGRWRPTVQVVAMGGGESALNVEIHTRLFRTVGSGIDVGQMVSRATSSIFEGVAVQVLEPADEVFFLVVHAAKHGAVHPKWLLDLHAARLRFAPNAWASAGARAAAVGASRPFWAAITLLEPAPPIAPETIRRMRPPWVSRALVRRLVFAADTGPYVPAAPWPRYGLEWALEDRFGLRLKRLAGVIERIGTTAWARWAPCRRAPVNGQLGSHRWLERALRAGQTGPHWLTLEGQSMTPTASPGDHLLVTPLGRDALLKEGELIVTRMGGRLVAHRLVEKFPGGVVTRGDAARSDDPPIAISDVLGRVVAIHRKGNAPDGGPL